MAHGRGSIGAFDALYGMSTGRPTGRTNASASLPRTGASTVTT